MPPSCASAIARRASVTVSIAAETSGRFRRMLREREVARSVSRGRTWENAGTSNTSSKVSALPRRRMGKLQTQKRIIRMQRAKYRFAQRSRHAEGRRAAATLLRQSSRPVLETMARCDSSRCSPLLVGAALPCRCRPQAQWKWRDKGGHIQYSDLPPPARHARAGHPAAAERRPARGGHRRVRTAGAVMAGSAPSAARGASSALAPKTVDPELEAKRKKAEAEQAAKNKAEEDQDRRREGRQLQPRARRSMRDARQRHPHRAHQRQAASASSSTTSSAPTRPSAPRTSSPPTASSGASAPRACAGCCARSRRASFGSICSGR